MSEKFHVIELSPVRAGFYDPVFNVNLTRQNPRAHIPAGVPVSGSIKAALASGGIIDVNGTLLAQLREETQASAESFRASEIEQTNDAPIRNEVEVIQAEKDQVTAEEVKEETHEHKPKRQTQKRSHKTKTE